MIKKLQLNRDQWKVKFEGILLEESKKEKDCLRTEERVKESTKRSEHTKLLEKIK